MRFPELKGKKYLGWVRCSTKTQCETSIDDQLGVLGSFAAEHEMVHVDDVVLNGVTGSIPGARTDVEAILARKLDKDDFDMLLIHDSTRLTRAGAQHAGKIRWELAAAGIMLHSVMDHVPENDFSDVIHTLQSSAARQTAKQIAVTSTRGSQSALRSGRSAHCHKPPYGIDRLYVTDNGSSHIIRNLPSGEQVKLDPATHEIVARFGRRQKTGRPVHYIKQKNESIVLVPGDPARVAIVRRIFSRRFIDNWGARRIALELNNEGVTGPSGAMWGISAINQIVNNQVYLGVGIANRVSNAIYYRRADSAPQPVTLDAKTLARRRRPQYQIRPSSEWLHREEPQLKDFLNVEIRRLVEAKQRAKLESQASGMVKMANRDRHYQSQYILKGILRLPAELGGHSYTGRSTGKVGKKCRYYAISRSSTCPTNDQNLRPMLRAEPLEAAILQMLSDCLSQMNGLRSQIRAAIDAEAQVADGLPGQIEELKHEREAQIRKIAFVVDQLDDIGADALKMKLNQMKARLQFIDNRLHELGATKANSIDVSEDTIIEKLNDLHGQLNNLSPVSLRRLLEAFISRAEVDPQTKLVTVELRLPLSSLKHNGMCLVEPFAWKTVNEAQPENRIPLAKTTLLWLPRMGYFQSGSAAAA